MPGSAPKLSKVSKYQLILSEGKTPSYTSSQTANRREADESHDKKSSSTKCQRLLQRVDERVEFRITSYL